MLMHRRQFKVIARVINQLDIGCYDKKQLAVQFAKELEKTNDKFDYEKFINAATKGE